MGLRELFKIGGGEPLKGVVFLDYCVNSNLEHSSKASSSLWELIQEVREKFALDNVEGECWTMKDQNYMEIRLEIGGYIGRLREALRYIFNSVGLPERVHEDRWFVPREVKEGYRLVGRIIENEWDGLEKRKRLIGYSHPRYK